MIYLLFCNLCVCGETLKMRNIRVFCLVLVRCFFTPERSTKQSLNCAWKSAISDRFREQILAFKNPVAANGYCLPRKLQIVGICALMVSSILNLCFQFVAIRLNGFFTEQPCKQTCIMNNCFAYQYLGIYVKIFFISGKDFPPLCLRLVKSFIKDNQSF